MFLPLGTDRPLNRSTVVNHALISLNLLAFAACLIAQGVSDAAFNDIVARFGLVWRPAEPWRFLTYTLIHAGWWHILGNMLFLWVFGASVEDRLGRAGYLALYVVGSIGAGVAHVCTSQFPVVGASGAVAAVSGAFLVFFPRTNIRTLILFFFMGIRNIPASWFIGFAIARDFIASGGDSVSHAGHLGGYGVGVLTALALLLFKVVPREQCDALTLFRHGQRRREIRAAVAEAQHRVRSTPGAPDNPIIDAVAEARAAVSSRLAAHDLPGAMKAYHTLLERHAKTPGAACLGRRQQLEIANAFFNTKEHAIAMAAYERFLDTYPKDPEIAHVKLLMGLIAARYLDQPDRARTLIADASPALRDQEQLGLAQELLADLRGGHPA